MGEVYFQTPGGHTICDCDPYRADQTPVLVGQEDKLHNIEAFYFYKQHIIGYGPGYYFIFDEPVGRVALFNAKSQWQQAIVAKNLNPVLYTNWLEADDSPETFLLIVFLWGILASPFILLILVIVAIGLVRRRISVSRRFLFRTCSVVLILALLAAGQLNIYSW
jgi:hypothetical protein